MPRVPGWWRWWCVRHLRWTWIASAYDISMPFGRPWFPYDCWGLFGIWHGLEMKHGEEEDGK